MLAAVPVSFDASSAKFADDPVTTTYAKPDLMIRSFAPMSLNSSSVSLLAELINITRVLNETDVDGIRNTYDQPNLYMPGVMLEAVNDKTSRNVVVGFVNGSAEEPVTNNRCRPMYVVEPDVNCPFELTVAPFKLYVPAEPVGAMSTDNVEPSSTNVNRFDDVNILFANNVEFVDNVRNDGYLSFAIVPVVKVFTMTS